MKEALTRGLAVRREYGIVGFASEAQVDAIVADAGLAVEHEYPFAGRLRALLAGGTIYLRQHLEPGEQPVLLAHELYHHQQHEHFGHFLSVPGHTGLRNRCETEAQLFAGGVVLGRPPPTRDGVTEMMQDAADAGVPPTFLWEWVSILVMRFPVVDGVPEWMFC